MNDLPARLHDLADSVPDWDDPLPAVLRGSPDRQRRWSWTSGLSVAAAVLAVLLVAGGVVALLRSGPDSSISSSAAGSGGPAQSPTCGAAPTASGPLAGSVRVTVSAPTTAPAGSTLQTRVTVQVVANGPTVMSGPSGLTVLRRGSVVTESAVSAIGIDRSLSIGSSTENASVLLRECSQSDTGVPLGPGEYQVVASLGYYVGTSSGRWVSAPITVTVR